jgi:putative phosphoesterase
MKIMFASDIHGSARYCKLMLERYRAEKAGRLVLLGDLLYHGPRNPLPDGYDPPEVSVQLNGVKDEILCVRGNCDAEVDQLLLEFNITADFTTVLDGSRILFITHGHLFSPDNPPSLKDGDVLIAGHTHIHAAEKRGGFWYINPGSVALPKGGQTNSYMIYENGIFVIKDLTGSELKRLEV